MAGVLDAAIVAGQAHLLPGACPHCSGPYNAAYHLGACPRMKAIEYHPNGTIRRVEYHREVNDD